MQPLFKGGVYSKKYGIACKSLPHEILVIHDSVVCALRTNTHSSYNVLIFTGANQRTENIFTMKNIVSNGCLYPSIYPLLANHPACSLRVSRGTRQQWVLSKCQEG